jgi:hypothetical protein
MRVGYLTGRGGTLTYCLSRTIDITTEESNFDPEHSDQWGYSDRDLAKSATVLSNARKLSKAAIRATPENTSMQSVVFLRRGNHPSSVEGPERLPDCIVAVTGRIDVRVGVHPNTTVRPQDR